MAPSTARRAGAQDRIVGEAGGGGAAGLGIADGLLQGPISPDEAVGDRARAGLAAGVGAAARLADHRAVGIGTAVAAAVVSGAGGAGGAAGAVRHDLAGVVVGRLAAGLVDETRARGGVCGGRGERPCGAGAAVGMMLILCGITVAN